MIKALLVAAALIATWGLAHVIEQPSLLSQTCGSCQVRTVSPG